MAQLRCELGHRPYTISALHSGCHKSDMWSFSGPRGERDNAGRNFHAAIGSAGAGSWGEQTSHGGERHALCAHVPTAVAACAAKRKSRAEMTAHDTNWGRRRV